MHDANGFSPLRKLHMSCDKMVARIDLGRHGHLFKDKHTHRTSAPDGSPASTEYAYSRTCLQGPSSQAAHLPCSLLWASKYVLPAKAS